MPSAGIAYLAGYPDRPPVTPGSATMPPAWPELYGALGVMFALRAQRMTGRRQFIDIGLYEPIFHLDELAASLPPQRLRLRRRHGTRHRSTLRAAPPAYPTKTANGSPSPASDEILVLLAWPRLQGEPGSQVKANGQR